MNCYMCGHNTLKEGNMQDAIIAGEQIILWYKAMLAGINLVSFLDEHEIQADPPIIAMNMSELKKLKDDFKKAVNGK